MTVVQSPAIWPEWPGTNEAELAPWSDHVIALTIIALTGGPGLFLLAQGYDLVGALLVLMPFVIICMARPFVGLCYLAALAPLDYFFGLGGGYASGSKLFAIAVAIGWFINLVRGGTLPFLREFVVIGAFALWAGLSVTWSLLPAVTAFRTLSVVLLASMAFMTVGLVKSFRQLRQLLLYATIASFLLSIILLRNPQFVGAQRATLGEFSPNEIAVSLMFGLVCAFYLLLRSKSWLSKLIFVIMSGTMLLGLVTTQSRGLLLTLCATAVIAPLVTYRKEPLKALVILLLTTAALSVIAIVVAQFGMLERITEAGLGDSGRFHVWRSAILQTEGKRLLGIGHGLFRTTTGGMVSHNLYVELLVELGVPGVLLWLLFAGMLMVRIARIHPSKERFFAAALLCFVLFPDLIMSANSMKTTWTGIAVLLVMVAVPRQPGSPGSDPETLLTEPV